MYPTVKYNDLFYLFGVNIVSCGRKTLSSSAPHEDNWVDATIAPNRSLLFDGW